MDYDANSPSYTSVGSNMIQDLNKGVSHIRGSAFRYNHLNLPERVMMDNGDYVKYTYDAAGLVPDSSRELS